MYKEFNEISLDTERLITANACFLAGKFGEARAILNANSLNSDLSSLLARKEQLKQEKSEVTQNLENISLEFSLLAQLTSIEFNDVNRVRNTMNYYEKSIEASENAENTNKYALFLYDNGNYVLCKLYLEKSIALYSENYETNYKEIFRALSNLLVIYKDLGEINDLIKIGEDTLTKFSTIVTDSSEEDINLYANLLVNLATGYGGRNEFRRGYKLLDEAYDIFIGLSRFNEKFYKNKIVTILNNKAVFLKTLGLYEDAIRQLLEAYEMHCNSQNDDDDDKYRYDSAKMKSNLADFYREMNSFEEANTCYQYSIKLFRELSENNPDRYMSKTDFTGPVISEYQGPVITEINGPKFRIIF